MAYFSFTNSSMTLKKDGYPYQYMTRFERLDYAKSAINTHFFMIQIQLDILVSILDICL